MFYWNQSNSHYSLVQLLENQLFKTKSINEFSFGNELIMVQNKGMQRWLTQEFTLRLGITHALDFQLPSKLLWNLYQTVCNFKQADVLASKKEVVQWKLFDLLHDTAHEKEIIKTYFNSDTVINQESKRWELAGKLASLFDEYEIYRTGELENKLNKENENGDWQFSLVKEMIELDSNSEFRFQLHLELIEKLRNSTLKLPFQKIFIYGIPTLPESSLRAFILLSKHIDVHFYQLLPSNHKDWSLPEKDISNHDFLQHMSKEGRDLSWWIKTILEDEKLDYETRVEWEVYEENTQLNRLKNSFINSDDRLENKEKLQADHSILLNAHYSEAREVESVRDFIIGLFQTQEVNPSEILIMSSDIDTYAPFIRQYFNEPVAGIQIPYSLADMKSSLSNETVQALNSLLNLFSGDLPRTEILHCLSFESIQSKINLDYLGYNRLKNWITSSSVRYGWKNDQNHFDWNDVSFEQFNSTLFQSIFYLPDETRLQNQILISHSIVSADDFSAWSAFTFFIRELSQLRDEIIENPSTESQPQFKKKIFSEWFEWLQRLVHLVLDTGDDTFIPNKIDALKDFISYYSPKQPISFPIFKRFIVQHFEDSSAGSGFLQGKITCSAMVPLRSIPFKYIFILGMSDGIFPGKKHRVQFDWLSKEPKLGDRDRKSDDYYLLLESILSAQKTLYISYLGKNKRDDSVIPQTPAITLLAKSIKNCCGFYPTLLEHPLYSQNEKYFDYKEFQPFNYNTLAAKVLTLKNQQNQNYHDNYLLSLNKELVFKEIDLKNTPSSLPIPLDHLFKMWENSGNWALKSTLGVSIPKPKEEIANDENFQLKGIDSYALKQFLFERLLENRYLSPDEIYPIIRLKGLIAHSLQAKAQFEEQFETIQSEFNSILEKYFDNEIPEKIDINVTISSLTISFSIYKGKNENHLIVRFSDFKKGKYKIRPTIWSTLVNWNNEDKSEIVLWSKNGVTSITDQYDEEITESFFTYSKYLLEEPFPMHHEWMESIQKLNLQLEDSEELTDRDKNLLIEQLLNTTEGGSFSSFTLEEKLAFDLNWKEEEWYLSSKTIIASNEMKQSKKGKTK